MMDDGIPQVCCPDCGQLDWTRDGFVVRATGPRIDAIRLRPGRGDEDGWSCQDCGHRLPAATTLARSLCDLQMAHWE